MRGKLTTPTIQSKFMSPVSEIVPCQKSALDEMQIRWYLPLPLSVLNQLTVEVDFLYDAYRCFSVSKYGNDYYFCSSVMVVAESMVRRRLRLNSKGNSYKVIR